MLRKISLFLVFCCINTFLLSLPSTGMAESAPVLERIVIKGFDEPIVATRVATASEKETLLAARERFIQRKDAEDMSALTDYLKNNVDSPYRLALLTDLGLVYLRTGHFSKCIDAFEQAWATGRDIRNHPTEALASRAAGELANMYARLGRYESLKALLDEVKDRDFRGPGSNLIEGARSGFDLMTMSPQTSFRCGPMALSRILASRSQSPFPDAIRNSASTREGMSLVQVRDIAHQIGLEKMKIVQVEPGAAIPVPAVVHWKVGHYAAILREENGRYFIEDPTFGSGYEAWVQRETLDEEATGYFLTEADELSTGWKLVSDETGKTIFGKGQTSGSDPNATGPDDKKAKPDEDDCGMPRWNVHSLLVSLNIHDTPLEHRPPVGPKIPFTVTYNSRENEGFTYMPHTYMGPKWNFSAIAYIRDYPESSAILYGGYGGSEVFRYNRDTMGYHRSRSSYATITRVALTDFEVRWPDGTKEYYGLPLSSGSVYRTKITDPAGNEVQFHYTEDQVQGTVRLQKIVDAIGEETIFEYGNGGLQPTKITDPAGRTAVFRYDSNGRLVGITDAAGMTSTFQYLNSSDFISSMATPYGRTSFTAGNISAARYLQVIHPNGDLERAEYRHFAEGIPQTITNLPTNMLASENFIHFRNALYWDRKAMREGGGDPSKARLTHFLHTDNVSIAAGLVESEKAPLEGRIWYNYQGQTDSIFVPNTGDERISKIGRLLEDGSTQLYELEYNEAGNVTKMVDPVGRTTEIVYDSNLSDVLSIHQKTGTNTSVQLASYTYNDQRRPLTHVDAAGRTTSFTYNDRGQVLTRTNPKGETTTFTYDTKGRLLTIDGPLGGSGDLVTFTWDDMHRIASVTDAAGLSMAMEYDNLNRLTKRTYSDGEYEQWTYDRLDKKSYRSRSGKTINYRYNELAQLVEIADDQNQKTLIDWCKCGSPTTIIDAMGKMTQFNYDLQGRITGKTYADGSSSQIVYAPLSGRIEKTIDEEGREQNFTFTPDNRIASISYGGNAPATPAVNLTWDPIYPRMTQMTDGTGTTTFGYHPVTASQNGVGQLASIDGPLANDTITFSYDELGRIVSRAINGSTESYTLDPLSRFEQVINPLGTFSYSFSGASSRLNTMTLPNGQTLQMTYAGAAGLQQLKQITHTGPGAQPISKFGFEYDDELRITALTNQIDSAAALVDVASYDSTGRLSTYREARAGGGTNTYQYTYDAAHNRTSESINGTNTTATINALNQVSTIQPISSLIRQYEWDGAGRITAIVQGANRSEFSYDGFGRRVRIVEKQSGSTVADRRFVWVGFQIAEERDASNNVVKRFFAQGFTSSAGTFFYTRDQIGSIREVVDSSGVIRARYDYDPFGRRVKLSGDVDADFGFSGHFYHSTSQHVLTYARAYDPSLGRWISRDASGESAGVNLYTYVHNNPLRLVDALGFDINAYSPDQIASGQQYADMAINTGKLLANTAAFATTVGVAAVTIAAAPAIGGALAVGAVALTGAAVVWTGYSVYHASRNLTLNSLGFQNDMDGNLLKDAIGQICGEKGDPSLKFKRAARDVAGVAADLATGKALAAWGGAAAALPAVGDIFGEISGVMDLAPAIMNSATAIPTAMGISQ